MRIEHMNRFFVPLRDGFDFLREVDHCPSWHPGITEILEAPPGGSWGAPGDTISFHYRVLGRLLNGTVEIKEMREYDVVRSVMSVYGLPPVHQEYRYTAVDEESFILKVVLETEEVTTLLGRVVDRALLPRIMERDLRRTMENLQDAFAIGVPEPVWWP